MRAIETLVAEGRNGRRREPTKSRELVVRIRTSPQVLALLDELAHSGLYPADPAAVAEELLRTKLREIEEERRRRSP